MAATVPPKVAPPKAPAPEKAPGAPEQRAAPAPDSPDAPPDVTAPSTGRIARLLGWARGHKLLSGIALLGLMGCLTAVVLVLWPSGDDAKDTRKATLPLALEALDRHDHTTAHRMAKDLSSGRGTTLDDYGGAALVLGTIAARQARVKGGEARDNYLRLAATYLEEAERVGFPDRRRFEGLVLHGTVRLELREYERSLTSLNEALPLAPTKRDTAHCHRLLSIAYENLPDPDHESALHHVERALADLAPTAAERRASEVRRCRILLKLGRLDDCRGVLKRLAPAREGAADDPVVLLLEGQCILAEARQLRQSLAAAPGVPKSVREKLEQAHDLFRFAEEVDDLRTNVTPAAILLAGRCAAEMGEAAHAKEDLDRVRRFYPQTQESLAAGLELGELRLAERDYGAAAAVIAAVAEEAGPPQRYSNAYVPYRRLQDRVSSVVNALAHQGQFAAAVKVTPRLSPLFNRATALRLTGENYAHWGELLQKQAAESDALHAPDLAREALEKFRTAGENYEQLAREVFATRDLPDALWQSARNYLRAKDYARAAPALDSYARHEVPGKNRPDTLLALAECHFALGEFDAALHELRECVEIYPRYPAAYEARLIAGKVYVEQNKLNEAERVLLEVLDSDVLTPASATWRESLFALGRLLHLAGRSSDAAARLEEAVTRYPDDPSAPWARFLLADSYRLEARRELARAEQSEGDLKTQLAGRARQMREAALEQVQKALESIQSRPSQVLTPLDRQIAVSCSLARPALLAELGRDADAIGELITVVRSLQSRPEVLDACLQAAEAYRRLNRPEDAQSTIAHARRLLDQLPADADFAGTSASSKQQWQTLLDWMQKL
ncbi:MAG: tetratricopeptide repeat protein [Planctomycetia bacterium]|nr:tetratricopeptide repeat protein [Planctomycetia bacterium]